MPQTNYHQTGRSEETACKVDRSWSRRTPPRPRLERHFELQRKL